MAKGLVLWTLDPVLWFQALYMGTVLCFGLGQDTKVLSALHVYVTQEHN